MVAVRAAPVPKPKAAIIAICFDISRGKELKPSCHSESRSIYCSAGRGGEREARCGRDPSLALVIRDFGAWWGSF